MSHRAHHRSGRWTDRVIGVLIGLVLGVAIVAAFVFLGGEETIDAPRLESGPAAERMERR